MDGIDSFNLGVRFNSLLSTEACVGVDSMIQIKIEMECLQIMSIKSRCLYNIFQDIWGLLCRYCFIGIYKSIYVSIFNYFYHHLPSKGEGRCCIFLHDCDFSTGGRWLLWCYLSCVINKALVWLKDSLILYEL